jgi:hypothetical protein
MHNQAELKELLATYLSAEYDEVEVKEQVDTSVIEIVDEEKKLVKITYDNGVSEFVEIKYKPYFCNSETEDL